MDQFKKNQQLMNQPFFSLGQRMDFRRRIPVRKHKSIRTQERNGLIRVTT